MMRLFIALEIPDAVRAALAQSVAWMGEHKSSVKVVSPENYHVTLKFLGSTPDEKVPEIQEALQREAPSLVSGNVRLSGWDVFPDKGRAQVFWAGVEPAQALWPAAERIEEAMGALGFAKETRDFHGHVTLARAGGGPVPGAFLERWRALPGLAAPDFPADTVTLYESRTLPSGPVYRAMSSVRLRALPC